MHAGLQVLVDDGRVLACHVSTQAAAFFSEVGSAHAILQAGYTLDSFLVPCISCNVILRHINGVDTRFP